MKIYHTKKNRITGRLVSRRGESLAETLAAILIIALALTLLAGMVTTAGRLIRKSRSHYADSVAVRNAIESRGKNAASPDSSDIAVSVENKAQTLAIDGAVLQSKSGDKEDNTSFKYQIGNTNKLTGNITLQTINISGTDTSLASLNGKAFTYTYGN